MPPGESYIRDYGDFIENMKSINHIAQDAVMVTTDVVGLYPSIPLNASLKALRKVLGYRVNKTISANDFTKMTEFVLKKNCFDFNGKVKKHISGTTILTRVALTDACIFMDQVETEFLETQMHKTLVWFRYIDDVFFIWAHGQEKLSLCLEGLNKFYPNIK